MRRIVLAILAVVALACAQPADARKRKKPRPTPTPVVTPAPTVTPVPDDALVRRVRAELKVFTDWLGANGVRGYIGEAGWPDDEPAKWNALANRWYADADGAGLWVTAWATGEWWGTSYRLAPYEDRIAGGGVDSANTQAPVLDAHSGAGRGVSDAGGEFGTPGPLESPAVFSNANPGAYDTMYHYDTQATFDFLAANGVRLVRIPFRWERVQRTPGAALDAAEVQRLQDAVARARTAGLTPVVDMHNYGAYWLSDGSRGVRYGIGSSAVPVTAFADVWGRLSAVLGGRALYGLMNEPVEMPGGAATWEQASKAAVAAIRANGDGTTVLVGGYEWSGAQRWSSVHPRAWIADANIRYEAHHYWDRDSSGTYAHSYADEVADAASRGY
jgi:hypothetical protein